MVRSERPPPPLELNAEYVDRIPQLFFQLEWESSPLFGGVDGFLNVTWLNKKQRYYCEYKRDWSELSFRNALLQAKEARFSFSGEWPLIVLPYLNTTQLQHLMEEGISGLDLAGNCCLHFPSERLIITGRPARHQQEHKLKNPYRGTSSLVSRMLLIQPRFRTGLELKSAIEQRGGTISQPMVSRVIQTLTKEALVGPDDSGHRITVLHPGKLLDQLAEHWRENPRVLWRGRTHNQPLQQAARALFSAEQPVVMTGLSSVGALTSLTTEASLSVYVQKVGNLPELAGAVKTSRFPNLTLYESPGDEVYFDARVNADGIRQASPIQAYLEARQGDSRLQQAADELRARILSGILKS